MRNDLKLHAYNLVVLGASGGIGFETSEDGFKIRP